jgi:hypothetical protein
LLSNEELYHDRGYLITQLPNSIMALLWNEIHSTNWVADTNEHIYKQIPDWYVSTKKYSLDPLGSNRAHFEREIGKDVFDNTPDSIKIIGSYIANLESFDFFRRYYSRAELCYIYMWNGSEEIAYHYDTINGTDTLVLIYLTEQSTWHLEWGGQISLKKQLGDVTIIEQEIDPLNGTMVIINNANPLVKHRVRKLLNTEVNRYTFSFNYNWI